MPNTQNHRKILEKLRLHEDHGGTRDDLEKILEEEINKPAEQVDSALVDELLDLLEEETPSEDVLDDAWKEIERKRKIRKNPLRLTGLKRWALAAAAMVLLLVFSVQTAQAFRWTFLLKLLQPMAETFGIYTESNSQKDISESGDVAYFDADTEFEQKSFASLEEMPREIEGYSIIPGWVPERFSFIQGTLYADADTTNISIAYQAEKENLLFTVVLFHNDEAVSGIEFEQTSSSAEPAANEEHLTYYYNNQGELRSISRISENAHYAINGNISEAELIAIMQSFR